jgi:thiol-disulfide isomerase/thioredoxin
LQGLHRGCSVVSVFDDFELQAISFLEDFSMRFASLYVAALLLTMTGSIPSAADAWRVGVHYIQLDNAEPAKLPVGEIEVVEFFWYSCPHCNAFEPFLLEWLKRKPAAVDFERIPVTWDANQESDARLYYVLRALRREDLHQAVFDTVHKQHKVLNTPDLQAEFSGIAWGSAAGVCKCAAFARGGEKLEESGSTGSSLQNCRCALDRHQWQVCDKRV